MPLFYLSIVLVALTLYQILNYNKSNFMSIIKHFKKYKHDWMIVLGVLVVGVVAVMGEHWVGTSKKPFWWTFWEIGKWVCLVAWVAGWIWAKAKDRRSK